MLARNFAVWYVTVHDANAIGQGFSNWYVYPLIPLEANNIKRTYTVCKTETCQCLFKMFGLLL